MNRHAGSGGGSGLMPLIHQGSYSGTALGAFTTAGPTTWTDITGTSFSFQVNVASNYLYLVYVTGLTSGVGLNGYVRGLVDSATPTMTLYYHSGGFASNGFIWLTGLFQPGTHSAKLQAATDTAGISITITQAFHQLLQVSA